MKQSNTFNTFTATLVFVVLGAPALALANTSSGIKESTATVTYADLNLGNQAGAQVLYSRLKRASREVCGVISFQNAGSVSRFRKVRQCYRETLTKSVDKIDNDLLTRIHAG